MGGHRRAAVASASPALDDLEVVGADINPRVVEHLRRARETPPMLTLVSEIRDSDTLAFAADYRHYFGLLGRTIGDAAVPRRAAPRSCRAT